MTVAKLPAQYQPDLYRDDAGFKLLEKSLEFKEGDYILTHQPPDVEYKSIESYDLNLYAKGIAEVVIGKRSRNKVEKETAWTGPQKGFSSEDEDMN